MSAALEKVRIRKAVKEDADTAALLTLMAYDAFAYYIFGVKTKDEVCAYYKKLWRVRRNIFSYEYSFVAEVDAKAAGILTCYSAKPLKALSLPTLAAIIKIGGLPFLRYVIPQIKRYYNEFFSVGVCDDELYIGTLAVLPEYRKCGAGRALIEFAAAQAQSENLAKCSLLASVTNKTALRFYQRSGFVQAVQKIPDPDYYKLIYVLPDAAPDSQSRAVF